MPVSLEPEYLKAIEQYIPLLESAPVFPVGDALSRRAGTNGLLDLVTPTWPSVSDVQQEVHTVKSRDGSFDIPVFHFTKTGSVTSTPGPVIFYAHGGGYYALNVGHYRKLLELYVSRTGIPLIAFDYRLAPEFPFPTPVDDGYTVLEYVSKNADLFKIDPTRIIALGDSAGGGLAAGLALKARDEGFTPPSTLR